MTAHICCRASIDADTNDLLRAFWETEEPPSDVDQLSHDDQIAITHFKDSVSREKDGRYTVQLSRRETAPPLGHSRSQAIRRYEQN